jgi:uncharacterized membrane protein YhdT
VVDTEPSHPPSSARLAVNSEELLWNYMIKQQEFSVSQFATALVGEGALLFAYGQLTSPDDFVRLLVAFLGLGTGVVLWLHSYVARRDALAIRAILKDSGSSIVTSYDKIHEWATGVRWFRPTTRLMTYVNGFIVLMWGTLLMHVIVGLPKSGLSGWPTWLEGASASLALLIIDLVIIVVALAHLYRTSDEPIDAQTSSHS